MSGVRTLALEFALCSSVFLFGSQKHSSGRVEELHLVPVLQAWAAWEPVRAGRAAATAGPLKSQVKVEGRARACQRRLRPAAGSTGRVDIRCMVVGVQVEGFSNHGTVPDVDDWIFGDIGWSWIGYVPITVKAGRRGFVPGPIRRRNMTGPSAGTYR